MNKKILKENVIEVEAKIIEVLPNIKFRVELPNKKIITAYVSGKLRVNSIRILPGDKVKVELSLYNFTEGRITYRYNVSRR